jgi:hypothetical protein
MGIGIAIIPDIAVRQERMQNRLTRRPGNRRLHAPAQGQMVFRGAQRVDKFISSGIGDRSSALIRR